MNMEIGTEAVQFPEKEYINGIFLAVQSAASPVSLNLLALLDLFFQPIPSAVRCIKFGYFTIAKPADLAARGGMQKHQRL
jgi:hypothetical protein